MRTGGKQSYVLTRALGLCLGAVKNSDYLIELGFQFLFAFPFACVGALRMWKAKNEKHE